MSNNRQSKVDGKIVPLRAEAPPIRRILTIDDNEAIHDDYRKVLSSRCANSELEEMEARLFGSTKKQQADDFRYEIDSAFQGEQGVDLIREALEEDRPYCAAFIDIRMPPGIDGIETANRIWHLSPDLPIVLCTAYSDHTWDEISKALPRTDQLLILKKPFDPVELRQMAASQTSRFFLNGLANQKRCELEQLVEQRTKQIDTTRDIVFFTLARLAESRDPETGEHLNRIESYVRFLLTQLNKQGRYQDHFSQAEIDGICRSSVLHDIGKVGIPDNVLLKPGRLTADEFEIMKTHAAIGAAALEDTMKQSGHSGFLKYATQIAKYHHERFDGTGYPCGLLGENIPLAARVVAVADVFDALTSERVYKKAMDPMAAKMLITSESGSHFDPEIVHAFNACWDQFNELATRTWQQAEKDFPKVAEDVQEPSNN